MTFSETENLIARYDAATTALDQAVTDRLSASLDASFRNLIKELERQYPTWQSEGSLYASQRRLLLVQELGGLLDVIKPEDAAQYQALLQEALQLSHTTGATLADELTRTIDPGYPLADFTTIPIEAAALQAREGVKRLYRYNEDFRTAASGIVEQGLIQGWGTKRVQSVMERELGVTKSKAETLARTEVMSALNGAAQQRYQQNGISWVMWQVAPSDRLCPVCAARDGNVYEVGQISLPAHPRGRCILVPMRREWIEKDLIDSAAIAESRDKTQAEFIAGGGKLDTGPTAWERKAGLTAAPTPVWKAGDAPLPPVAKPAEPKPKRTRKPKATPAPVAVAPPPTAEQIPQNIEQTIDPAAVGGKTQNGITHKPLMTKAEASAYTMDSAYAGETFYHGTVRRAVDSITTEGVDPSRNTVAVYGQGFYTARDFDEAKYYANLADDGAGDAMVIEMRLDIRNPRVFADKQAWMEYQVEAGLDPYDNSPTKAARATQRLKADGFDGLEVQELGYIVAFDPSQVAIFNAQEAVDEDW